MKKREEIEEKYKWDLKVFYKDDKAFENDIKKIKRLVKEITKFKGSINQSAENIIKVINLLDEIERIGENLSTFSAMSLDINTTSSKSQERKSKIDSLLVLVQTNVSFVIPETMKCPQDIKEQLMKDKKYSFYKHALKKIFDQSKHVLSENEEKIIASYSEISEMPYKIFSMLNNADMKFEAALDSKNKKHEVSHGNFSLHMVNKDRTLRENVYKSLYKGYIEHINTLASTLEAMIKGKVAEAKLRNYKSALHASLSQNKIPIKVYENLINAINSKMSYHKQYIETKKELLDVDKLHFYDVYMPLVKNIEYNKEYEDAKKIILEALKVLGNEYVKTAKNGLENRWVDVYETPGKRSGAYSWGTYDTPPLMLLNYQGTLDSVFTLAHELGHSMHSYLSKTTQKHLYAQYPIFLAEIASTVNEVLLSLYLLDNTVNNELKLYILNHLLEGFKSTVYRQTMFAEFEREIYQIIEKGEGLSSEILNNKYKKILKQYFGTTIEIDDKIQSEWARIPHFYYNYYVYQYAIGFTTAVYIAKRIYGKDEEFRKKYIKFLSSGGKNYPINILKNTMKIDLSSPEIIEESLDYFGKLLQDFRNITLKNDEFDLNKFKENIVISDKVDVEKFIENIKTKWIVLYFYPKDNTSGCTTEAKEFTELKQEFNKLNCEIIGVSPDTCSKHKQFIEKHSLKIALLCDPELNLIKKFDVWKMKKNFGKEYMGLVRSTFLMDPNRKVIKAWKNVRAKGHARKVLEYLNGLDKK